MDYMLNLFPCSCYYSRYVQRTSILPSATMAALMNSFPVTELRWCPEDKEPCNTTYGSMKNLLESQNLQTQQKVKNKASNGGWLKKSMKSIRV